MTDKKVLVDHDKITQKLSKKEPHFLKLFFIILSTILAYQTNVAFV